MDTRHSIEEFVFELNFDDLAPAADFEASLHDWLRQELLPPFEALFDSLSGPGEIVRLDVLEIDLGDLAYEDLRHELPLRLMEKLRAALEERLARQRGGSGKAMAEQGGTRAEAALPLKDRDTGVQELLDFLAHGRLPWQASADRLAAHEHLLARVAERDADALLRGIAASPQRTTMVERLVRQFPAVPLMALAQQAMPGHKALLRQLAELFPADASQPFWAAVFYALLDGPSGDARSLAERILERFRGTAIYGAVRTTAADRLARTTAEEERHLLNAIVAASSDALPPVMPADTSVRQAAGMEAEAPRDLESVWRTLREARANLDALDFDAAEMARLVAFFIERDGAAGVANRAAFLRAIEQHGAQARQKKKFYSLVLQSLLDGKLVDLEGFLRASLGAESPGAPQAIDSPQMGAPSAAAGAAQAAYLPQLDARQTPSAPAHPAAEDDGPLRYRLAHCLLNGDVPQLESIWHLLYRRRAGLTREALLHYGKFERVQRRFALDYSDAMLRDFIELIEPRAVETVVFLTDRATALASTDSVEWKRAVWDAAFVFLLRDGAAAFSRTGLAEFLFQRIAVRDAAHFGGRQAAILAWSKKLRGDSPSAFRLAAWRAALAEQTQSAGDADQADGALLARLIQNVKRRRKGTSEPAPALMSALDLVFTTRPQLLRPLLEAYRRGDLPALPLTLEREQLRRLVLAWVGLMPRRSSGTDTENDDLAAFADDIDRQAGASADPAAYLRAVLEQLRQGRRIDLADPTAIVAEAGRYGSSDDLPISDTDSDAISGTDDKAATAIGADSDGDESTFLSEPELLQRIEKQSRQVFGRSKARQVFHTDLLRQLDRTLDRHGLLVATRRQLESGVAPDIGAMLDSNDPDSAALREHVLPILRESADRSPSSLLPALSHLREVSPETLSRIGEAELLALVERYLESVALADAGNRRLFMETATGQARQAGDRKRFLALVLSHLVRNVTVDFDDILARSVSPPETGRFAPSNDAPANAGTTAGRTAEPIAGPTTGPTAGPIAGPIDDTAAAGATQSLVELRANLSHAVARKAMDAGRRAAFLHAIEHHAQLATDRRAFYQLVGEAVERDEAVDLEAFVQRANEPASLHTAATQATHIEHAADARQDSWEPFMSEGADHAAELAHLRKILGEEISRQSVDEARQAAFVHAIEHHAQLAADKRRFYALVFDAVAKGDAVDLESCVEQAAVPSAAVGEDAAMPAPLRAALEEGDAKRTEAALRDVFARKLRSFEQVRGWFADGDSGRRLFNLLSPAAATRVFSLLLGADYSAAERLAEAAVDALAFVSGRIPRQSAIKLRQRTIFELLLARRVDFEPQGFAESAAALIAGEADEVDARLVRELIESHFDTHFAAARTQPQQGAHAETGKSSVAVAAKNALPAEESSLSNVDVHLGNAGLILVWPYLPNLFTRLNLMEKNAFIDTKAAERAVHLLQFMATGETHTPEYALVLNKQLCGVATGAPIIGGIDITDLERETMESLLQAMIDHWKVIGKTSINGFREAFLQRQGWLTLAEDVWHLRVQTRAYDMLLDQLPWGISMVKLAWMPRPINVKWR